MEWKKLKSGSDVRGTAIGEGIELTNDIAKAVGMAFVYKLIKEKKKTPELITVAIGRDSRITGPDLLKATAEGIMKAGANVVSFGMCTTPAMYMCIITPGYQFDGSVMVTASHHPWNKNGLKFFTEKGGIEGKDVEDLLTFAEGINLDEYPVSGTCKEETFLPVYQKQLMERIRLGLNTSDSKPLSGLHIVVDAGNGAGGFYADMLQNLGADTTGSQFLDPDGYFPNHIPNPENPDAIQSLKCAVIHSKADLGVIFDTDCDRAAVVDSDGKEINRNRLIALISAILLEKQSGLTIVTDSVTSSGLEKFIRSHGGIHYRYKRGYRNVIDEAIRLNNEGHICPLAIETSGHAALSENHFLDDGMYLVTLLIVKATQLKKAGKSLGSLIIDLKEPVESKEIRLSILSDDFRSKGEEIVKLVTEHAEMDEDWHIATDNREGIRINFDINGIPDSGWFLLRLSVHDPVLPINTESDISGGVKKMLSSLYHVLENIDGIDKTPLIDAIR